MHSCLQSGQLNLANRPLFPPNVKRLKTSVCWLYYFRQYFVKPIASGVQEFLYYDSINNTISLLLLLSKEQLQLWPNYIYPIIYPY